MKASEIIEKLQELIEKFGDLEVFSGGEDYHVPVEDVFI